jgi:tripartite-type tricarboxylate transporter receptor subunit TctC
VHATPRTPPDRVKILEAAFTKAVDDPESRARMKKQERPVVPITGQELGQIAEETLKLQN